MFSIRSHILLPEGVTLMTMIAMAQEAVACALAETVSAALGALATGAPALRPAYHVRYRFAGTATGQQPSWEAHVLAPSPIARSAYSREAAPPATLPFERKGKYRGFPEEPEPEPGQMRLNSLKLFEIVKRPMDTGTRRSKA